MSREIPLTKGLTALVDDEDYAAVSSHSWCADVVHQSLVYAQSRLGNKTQRLLRFVLVIQDGAVHVDHINGNGLDCRKKNLRVCTVMQNHFNMKVHADSTTGYTGVSFNRAVGKYESYINKDGRRTHLGYFTSKEEAKEARDSMAIVLHKEFARTQEVTYA